MKEEGMKEEGVEEEGMKEEGVEEEGVEEICVLRGMGGGVKYFEGWRDDGDYSLKL